MSEANQYLELLREIVGTPSLSGEERGAVRRLVERGREFGLRGEIDGAGNAVLCVGAEAGQGVKDIVLLGHIDTVAGWIDVREEGGVLHGRGTVDAKGPLCAFVCAAAGLELPAGVRVVVIGAVEEECPTSKGARFAAGVYTPSACIIGEPSGVNGVTLGYKGRLIARVRCEMEESHSAGPGATACERVVDWWNAARALAREQSAGKAKVFEQVQARLRDVRSESDGSRERASAEVGFRLPPGVEPSAWEARLRAMAESGEVEIECVSHERAHASGRDDAVARALSGAIRRRGMTPAPKLKTGTSDMNVVAPVWRCPIAAYGAGDSGLDHTPREHVVISEWLESIEVLRAAIGALARELAGGEGS
jgi:[amino group carrier protein]-lysine/ornithine hydrolase